MTLVYGCCLNASPDYQRWVMHDDDVLYCDIDIFSLLSMFFGMDGFEYNIALKVRKRLKFLGAYYLYDGLYDVVLPTPCRINIVLPLEGYLLCRPVSKNCWLILDKNTYDCVCFVYRDKIMYGSERVYASLLMKYDGILPISTFGR